MMKVINFLLQWLTDDHVLRDHSFISFAKFSEKRVRIRGVRNVSFSDNFAYVLNE